MRFNDFFFRIPFPLFRRMTSKYLFRSKNFKPFLSFFILRVLRFNNSDFRLFFENLRKSRSVLAFN